MLQNKLSVKFCDRNSFRIYRINTKERGTEERNPNLNNNSGYRGNRVLWSQPHHLAEAEEKAQRYPGHYNQNQYNQSTIAWSSQYHTKKCVGQHTEHVDLERVCPKAAFTSHDKQQVFKKIKNYLLQNTFGTLKKNHRPERKETSWFWPEGFLGREVNTHSHNRIPFSRAARKSSVPKLCLVTD